MTENEKIVVNSIDEPDIETERPIEKDVASIDKFSTDALAFWREYLRRPKGRRAKTYRSRASSI
jgi:hypothetical protein